jgi:hypothetical protein
MSGKPRLEDLLVTRRQKALFKILSESGATEDGKDAEGRLFKDAPPYGMTIMLDMTLGSNPDEDQLADVLCWGDPRSREQARPLARKILKLIQDDGSSPA